MPLGFIMASGSPLNIKYFVLRQQRYGYFKCVDYRTIFLFLSDTSLTFRSILNESLWS